MEDNICNEDSEENEISNVKIKISLLIEEKK